MEEGDRRRSLSSCSGEYRSKIFKYSGEYPCIVFEVSTAKKQVLKKLADRDWSPTDLADELGKSPGTIYNHLHELADKGVVTTRQVAAKTRPKTEYSIGDGFVQYIAVLPGRFAEDTLALDANKAAFLRIWLIPQPEFHPYLEELWWQLKQEDGLRAAAVYGSVARGEADADSDIDVLLLAENAAVEERLVEEYGSCRLTVNDQTKLCMAEVYTLSEYHNSMVHGSEFLTNVQKEAHLIYDPDRLFDRPEAVIQ